MHHYAIKKLLNRIIALIVVTLSLVSLFALSMITAGAGSKSNLTDNWACGSYTLCKNGGYRPYLEYFTNGATTTAGITRKTYINVYMKAGERVALGSSVYNSTLDINDMSGGSNCDIIIIEPDGTKVSKNVIQNGEGYIANVAQETAGPNVDGTNTSGFEPIYYTAASDGVYQVRFHSSTGVVANPTQKPVTAAWSQNSCTVAAWNATVVNKNNVVQPGRIYTKCLALNMGKNKDGSKDVAINSNVYVVTSDGYIYNTDFNGMNPYGFIFFANNRGLVSTKTNCSLYQSFVSNNNQLTDLAKQEATYQDPWNVDTDMDKTFNIFFESPDPELEGILYPTSYEPETAKNLSFIGSKGDNSTHIGYGGYFKFDVSNATSATITIDLSNVLLDDGTTADYGMVKISNAVTHGTNYFQWDGCGENGELIPVGTYDSSSIKVSVETYSGEYHFPLFDVEGAPNGIKVTRINAIYREAVDENGDIYKQDVSSKYDDKKSFIFYDNATREKISEYHNLTNRIADGANCLNGVDSADGAMKFNLNSAGNYYGDQTSLDIWTHSNNGTPLSITLGTPIEITDDLFTVLSGRVFYDEIYTEGATNNFFALSEKDYALTNVEVELTYSYQDYEGVEHNETRTAITDSYGKYFFAGIPIVDNGNITTCQISVKKPLGSYNLTTQNTTTNSNLTKGTEFQTVTLGGIDKNNQIIYSTGIALSDVGYHYDRLVTGLEIKKDWVTDISSDNVRPTEVKLTVQAHYIDSSNNRVNVKDYEYVLNNANRWIIYANELPAYEDVAKTRPLQYEIISESYTMRGSSGNSYTFNNGDSVDTYPYDTSFSIDTSRSEITALIATNAPKLGTIQIVKRDSQNHSLTLQGVEFELWKKTTLTEIPIGEESDYKEASGGIYHKEKSELTNENGVLSFVDLEMNSYFVIESATKVGYRIDDTIYNFTLSNDNQFISQTVYNTPIMSALTVIKEVDSIVPGESVPITVSYSSDEEFTHPVTKNYTANIVKGKNTYNVCNISLPFGSYVKISEGESCYSLNSEESSVYNTTKEQIVQSNYSNNDVFKTSDGDSYTVTLYNNRTVLSYSMKIKKIDASNNSPLEGATFTMYSDAKCTAEISSQTTEIDSNGDATATFSELDAGTFYLKETVAPSGYILPKDVKEVVISTNGNVTVDGYNVSVLEDVFSITIANSLQITIPQSGTTISSFLIVLIGIMISIIGFGFLFILMKRKGDRCR